MKPAFNGVVFRDDALIVTMRCRKIYGPQPKLVVTVSPVAAVTETRTDIAETIERVAAAAQPALKLEAAA